MLEADYESNKLKCHSVDHFLVTGSLCHKDYLLVHCYLECLVYLKDLTFQNEV